MAAANNDPTHRDTIYALSSGLPPAAIAIIRISGPDAGPTLDTLCGKRPAARRASYRSLRTRLGGLLDHALILWFPGPTTATGEDLAELHLHGGRAVVQAVLGELAAQGLRHAEPGEFTRRALFNGRLELSAVEGLADLLAAETESQRKEALRRADGLLARKLSGWTARLVDIAAHMEAEIDYDGEIELDAKNQNIIDLHGLIDEIGVALSVPPVERLRDGLRVAIIGPPNAGKSTLFNALVGRNAAIVSEIAGTTRDAIERPVSIGGMPFILVDTAGLRETADPIERIGVDRAREQQALADIVLDLSGESGGGPHVISVPAKADILPPRPEALALSAVTGEGLVELHHRLSALGARLLPGEGEVALDRRYRDGLYAIQAELAAAVGIDDPLLQAEHVRLAREMLDGLTGSAGIEDMLDALFGRFCLGK